MTHANAPLTPEGRHRLLTRVLTDGRPIAHVAAEAGITRSTLSKWVARYRAQGADGLEDRTSRGARLLRDLDRSDVQSIAPAEKFTVHLRIKKSLITHNRS